MADVKWIKITTDVFDDEKILLIESLPEADSIIVIWFKLLCLAGKQNNSGVFIMGNSIPYTEKMLATIFRRKEATVQMALKTFEQFGMVEIVDGVITIPNWEKHQSLDKLAAAKEKTRKRVAKHRENQKLIAKQNASVTGCNATCNATCNAAVTECNADRIEEDKKRKEGDIERDNILSASAETETTIKHGIYKNVEFTAEEFDILIAEFPDTYQSWIEKLSSYMASTGKAYKNHLATIRSWAAKEKDKQKQQPQESTCQNPFLNLLNENEGAM